MTLKRKVLVSTLATSLAVSAFAGLPLSSKGLAEKLGVGVASAATTNVDKLQNKIDAVYNKLKPTEREELRAKSKQIYDELKGWTKEEKLAAIKPLTDKLQDVVVDSDQQAALLDLFYATVESLDYPLEISDYEDLLQNPDVAAAIDRLEEKLGVNVTVEGIAKFALDAAKVVNKKINSQIADVLKDPAKRSALFNDVEDELLKDNNSEPVQLLNAAVAKGYFSSNAEVKDVLKQVYNNVNSKLSPIAIANKNYIVTTLATAYYKSVRSGGGGSGAVDSNAGSVADLLGYLSSLKEKLANATDAEKQALIKEALEKANSVLAVIFKIDVSGNVSVNGEAASVTVSTGLVSGPIQDLKDIKEALVDAIGSADGLVIPTATFVAGNVDQTDVTNIAPEDVLSLLSGAGVNKVAFTTNGLTVTLPDTGDFAKGIEFSFKTAAATSEQTGGRAIASDVYTFSLKLGGTEVEKFSQPITIKFPVKGDGIDSELLTVARIESDGSLTILGGEDDTNAISLLRQKLSSYVVVENKVTFKDIGSVQAWAGRQIEVVAAKGAIQGKAAGVFAPKDSITRAEFAKILVSALGLADAEVPASQFTDVNANAWYAPYVAIAADKGIINGRSATTFDPNATITRAELSTMIARALKTFKGVQDVSDVDAALAGFSDAGKISSTLKAGVALAASKNIVIGDAGKFRPNDTASRAEAAVIVYRTLKVKA